MNKRIISLQFVDLSELLSRSTGNFWRFFKLCLQTMLLRVVEGEFIQGLMFKIELFLSNILRNLRLCETIWVCVNFVLKFVRTHLLKSSTEQYLYYHKGVLFLLGAVENFSSSLMGQWSWYLFFYLIHFFVIISPSCLKMKYDRCLGFLVAGLLKQENRFDWSFSKDRISGHIAVKV